MRNAPVVIETMLKCYYLADPPQVTETTSPAVFSALQSLKSLDLIDEDHNATPRGALWVAMICKTPYPMLSSIFIDPRTNEVVKDD